MCIVNNYFRKGKETYIDQVFMFQNSLKLVAVFLSLHIMLYVKYAKIGVFSNKTRIYKWKYFLIWIAPSLILCYVLHYINTTSNYYFLITSESNMPCLLFPEEKSKLWASSVFSHISLTNNQNYNNSCVGNCT